MTIWQDLQSELDALAAADLLRRPVEVESACGPRVWVAGREVVCLCSNDYLGLANDPAVKAAAVAGIERYGVGAGASRLVSGTQSPHARLERRLAAFKRTGDAVVTSAREKFKIVLEKKVSSSITVKNTMAAFFTHPRFNFFIPKILLNRTLSFCYPLIPPEYVIPSIKCSSPWRNMSREGII